MPAGEHLLDDLADAVLDGAAVDWAAAESSAGEAARPLVRHLQLVSSIARVHRDVLPTETIPPPVPLPETTTREHWGHLRILERVGRGAFGEVFRAWDTRLDREVALKLLPAAPSWSRNTASSIIQEGRLLAKVRHPNVVIIHGAEQIGDEIGLSMEFVRGQTLEQLLRQGTVFTEADVIHIGLELARAVSAVHSAGLLHRDIKAHNVTRAEDGRIVLMDFGTGRELDDSSSLGSRRALPGTWRRKCSPAGWRRSRATSTAWVCCCITSSRGRIPSGDERYGTFDAATRATSVSHFARRGPMCVPPWHA